MRSILEEANGEKHGGTSKKRRSRTGGRKHNGAAILK